MNNDGITKRLPLRPFAALLLAAMAIGCGNSPSQPVVNTAVRPVVDPLEPIRDGFRQTGDAGQLRRVLEQVNGFVNKGDRKPEAITDQERNSINALAALRKWDADALARSEFTPIDAAILEQLYFFRDVAKSLDVAGKSPLIKATAALAWTVRTVRQLPDIGPPVPPMYVALRGHGSALERTYVFIAVLQQLGVGPVWVVGDSSSGNDPRKCWAVGITTSEGLALFDSRLGIPLPGPNGILTLEQLQKDADLLRALSPSKELSYDVNAARLADSRAWLATPLPLFAPRFRFLATLVPPGSMPDFAALPLPSSPAGLKAGQWSAEIIGTPVRLDSEFHAASEGGLDPNRPGQRRIDQFQSGLVPWDLLPPELRELPGPPGDRVRDYFVRMTTFSYSPGLPDQLRQRQQLMETIKNEVREMKSSEREQALRAQESIVVRANADDVGPSLRQLILRGRYDEATQALVILADQMNKARNDNVPDEAVKSWLEQARGAVAEFLRVQRASDVDATARSAANARLEIVMRNISVPVRYMQVNSADAVASEVLYMTALCKHGQAELRSRSTTGEAAVSGWRTAQQTWSLFLTKFGLSPFAGDARRHLAIAQREAGQKEAAVQSFRLAAKDLPSAMEKLGCELEAVRLSAKP